MVFFTCYFPEVVWSYCVPMSIELEVRLWSYTGTSLPHPRERWRAGAPHQTYALYLKTDKIQQSIKTDNIFIFQYLLSYVPDKWLCKQDKADILKSVMQFSCVCFLPYPYYKQNKCRFWDFLPLTWSIHSQIHDSENCLISFWFCFLRFTKTSFGKLQNTTPFKPRSMVYI